MALGVARWSKVISIFSSSTTIQHADTYTVIHIAIFLYLYLSLSLSLFLSLSLSLSRLTSLNCIVGKERAVYYLLCQGAIESVLAAGGEAQWQRSLDIEWGGMNDALFNLAAITGDDQWTVTAYYFNHWTWSAPLVVGIDDLDGNHVTIHTIHTQNKSLVVSVIPQANTHIPEVVGDARGYELTGNTTKLAVVKNFFSIVTQHHSYPTGGNSIPPPHPCLCVLSPHAAILPGSSDSEMWGKPDAIGDYLNDRTEETCTQASL